MKKYLLICFILCFSSYVYAENTEDIIKKTCNGFTSDDYFYTGLDCSGLEKNIYYIKDKKVTKEKYNSEKVIYNEKGPICEETINSTSEELPQDFSAKCIKGSYGEYYHKDKILPYLDWKKLIIGSAMKSTIEKAFEDGLEILKTQKEQLQTFDSFVKSIKDGTWIGGYNTYQIVGGKCDDEGSMIVNGDGYKNLVCKNNKIESVDYIIEDKVVSEYIYMKKMYEENKKKIDAQIEYYKTHDSMGNKKLDIGDNKPKEQKTETNLNTNKKTKAQYIKQLVTSKNKLKENFDEKVISGLDKKLNTIKDKIKKEEPQKQKVILENLYIGFEKMSTKYKENKGKDLLEYTKSYFELNFFNL